MNKYQHRLDILAALFAIRDVTHKRNILSLANGPVKQSEKRPITVNVGAKATTRVDHQHQEGFSSSIGLDRKQWGKEVCPITCK